MIISTRLRYVYLAIPRTASKSVGMALLEHFQGESPWPEDRYTHHDMEIPERALTYFIWTTVRDPYARMWSTWYRLRYLVAPGWAGDAIKKLTFKNFMKQILEHDRLVGILNDQHELHSSGKLFWTQSRWLDSTGHPTGALPWMGIPDGEKLTLEIIPVKMEHLDAEFNALPFVTGDPFHIPNIRDKEHVPTASKHYTPLTPAPDLDDEDLELVRKHSREDFLRFDY